jgi:hypothetical protein
MYIQIPQIRNSSISQYPSSESLKFAFNAQESENPHLKPPHQMSERIPPIEPENITPEQKEAYAHISKAAEQSFGNAYVHHLTLLLSQIT